jgi:hypothetical protein
MEACQEGSSMKIILELNDVLGFKMEIEPNMTYPIAFGLLKMGLEDCILHYRLRVIDEQDKQEKARVKAEKLAKKRP